MFLERLFGRRSIISSPNAIVRCGKTPVGLRVSHYPNQVRAAVGIPSGYEFTWVYSTTLAATDEDVTIQEFGCFSWVAGRWVFSNFARKPFGRDEFAEWYSCPEARIRTGRDYVDPKNWSGNRYLQAGRARWVYIGRTDAGKLVRGDSELQALPERVD
jgi:hypothetical protein